VEAAAGAQLASTPGLLRRWPCPGGCCRSWTPWPPGSCKDPTGALDQMLELFLYKNHRSYSGIQRDVSNGCERWCAKCFGVRF
jgi:hypothetical protein